MAGSLATPPYGDRIRMASGLWNDFESYTDAGLFTKGNTGSGTSVASGNADNGVLVLTSGATGNNEVWFATTNKLFTAIDNRSFMAECLLSYTEASTNQAGIYFGFHSSFAAGLLADTTFALGSSFSGMGIYKILGSTVWKCVTSKSTTQTLSTSTLSTINTGYVRLRIEVQAVGDPAQDIAEVTFYVDDLPLYDAAVTFKNQPIKHQLTYTSFAQCKLGVMVKAGTTASEVISVDALGWAQERVTWPIKV